MINLKNLGLLLKVNAHKKFYGAIGEFFKSDKLRCVFTLQSLYIGINPLTAPGIFYSLPSMELTEGVWFPKGGMSGVAANLAQIAQEAGVEIHINQPIQEIVTENNKAIGIKLENGNMVKADVVVTNADLPYTYNKLLKNDPKVKEVNKLKYSCSAVVFHWAMDKLYSQLEQHNVFISSDYKKYLNTVFSGKILDGEVTFYLHSPCQADGSAAPKGQDSITVIVPVANTLNGNNTDWVKVKDRIKKGIIQRLETEGLMDFEKHIKSEKVFTPDIWKSVLNLSHGSTFGSLDHTLLQMGYFRPHNQHAKYKNLYFVGGSTHPGSGVPMTLVSAKLTVEKIGATN